MPAYDRTFNTPAPVVDVIALHPAGEARRVALRAKLDTGADITVIPDRLLSQLRLMPHGLIWTRGYDGAISQRAVYYVRLIIEEVDFRLVRCIAAARLNILLGRNALNRFMVTLDGKNLTFDMRDP